MKKSLLLLARYEEKAWSLLAALVFSILPVTASAHHGFRGYESSSVTVEGRIDEVKYANPHVMIELMPKGNGEHLHVLFPPPWSMISRGLPESELTEGKAVTVVGNLNRRDHRELLAQRMLIDGKTVIFRGGLADTEVAHAMHSDPRLFPFVEIFHLLALALVVGASAIFDLRLLGVAKAIRVTALARFLLPWSLGAFGVSVLSGGLLFLSDPDHYLANNTFRLKLLLIALAGLNAAVFRLTTYKNAEAWDLGSTPPLAARVAGGVSLAVWTAVIFAGRLIAYS